MKKVFLTIVTVLLIEAAGGLVLVYSGAYNVSVLNHDNGFINWSLDEGGTRSIKQYASGIMVTPLDDPAKVREGVGHYNEMCLQCHGAPGAAASEIAKGLWPSAPDLSKTVPEWTSAQLFWITKNGIKFSAMPAWGPTHSDEKIWDIVAFLEKLPNLSPADYRQMSTKAPSEKEGSGESAVRPNAAPQ
jgi:mono/diheme cytochrome c family protein